MAGNPHNLDQDLLTMTWEELRAEVEGLRAAIRAHRDASSHDLCWYQPELWGLLPEGADPSPAVPEWPEFLAGCIHYRRSLDQQLPTAPMDRSPS